MDRNRPKRKVIRTSIELKKELIANFEKGARVMTLSNQYGLAKSTISSILKKKDVIKEANVAKGVTVLAVNRSSLLEELEKLLLIWVNEKRLIGELVTEAMICEKAKQLHLQLLINNPGTSDDFKASRGWFCRFKKRSGIPVVRHGEASVTTNANKDIKKFAENFRTFVESEGFTPQQVFSCDETSLFWKKMPKKTYIIKDEKAMPDLECMKERLTLLLCSNASGDLKIKPLLVYKTETPSVFRKNNVIKSNLNVMWRANSKTWVSRQLFTEWVREEFAPTVKKYLEKKNLPLKALLVMDTDPAHPPSLEQDLEEEHNFIKVKFLSFNISPLIHPIDQQVISNFKRLYTKALFQSCFQVHSLKDLNFWDFWKNHFNILHCLRIIDKAWMEISSKTLNCAWKRLWPDCVPDRNFDTFETDQKSIVEDIITLGKSMGLILKDEDIEELVANHKKELTFEELQEINRKQQEELSVEEMSISSSEINELCFHWESIQGLVEKWHPNIAVANRSINLFNDNVVEHFRKISKSREKQTKSISSTSKQRSQYSPLQDYISENSLPDNNINNEDFEDTLELIDVKEEQEEEELEEESEFFQNPNSPMDMPEENINTELFENTAEHIQVKIEQESAGEEEEEEDMPEIKRRCIEDATLFEDPFSPSQTTHQIATKEKDDCDTYGELIANKLRTLDEKTKCMIKNKIDNLLFEIKVDTSE